jgi:hypothetical protein
MAEVPQAPEIDRSPDVRLLASFPIIGRENLQLQGCDGRRVAQVTKFTCRGNFNDPDLGQTDKEYAVMVNGNVGHYEDHGVVDIYEASITNRAGTKNSALTAVVRDPKGAALQPAIFTNTLEDEKYQ